MRLRKTEAAQPVRETAASEPVMKNEVASVQGGSEPVAESGVAPTQGDPEAADLNASARAEAENAPVEAVETVKPVKPVDPDPDDRTEQILDDMLAGIEAARGGLLGRIGKIIDERVDAAITSRENRRHLKSAVPGSATTVGGAVPPDVFAEYRRFFPNLSAQEIGEHWQKTENDQERMV